LGDQPSALILGLQDSQEFSGLAVSAATHSSAILHPRQETPALMHGPPSQGSVVELPASGLRGSGAADAVAVFRSVEVTIPASLAMVPVGL
jgi:hypothetical protein